VRNATVADWPTEGSANANWGRASRSGGRHLALAVADASLEPVYSCGNTLVISQDAATRPGDRVIVKPAGQSAVPRLLISSSRTLVGLERLGHPSAPESVRRRDIDWMARIVLVRQ
jgi:phage repressor protein C with HTH and peptisase S24 domain